MVARSDGRKKPGELERGGLSSLNHQWLLFYPTRMYTGFSGVTSPARLNPTPLELLVQGVDTLNPKCVPIMWEIAELFSHKVQGCLSKVCRGRTGDEFDFPDRSYGN